MPQVANKVLIFLNGTLYESKNGASLSMGGVTREPIISDNRHIGPSEGIEAASVEATFVQTADVTVANLNAFKGTLTYEQDTGVTYVIANAYSAGNAKLSKGEISVTFHGDPAEQA